MSSNRTYTLNGCYYTQPSIYPKDWKTGGLKSLELTWKIQYYFFDPSYENKYPYGKSIIVKGMNEFKSLSERREATQIILKDEIHYLDRGYNKFTNEYMVDRNLKYGLLHPHLKHIDAFRIALEKIQASKNHKNEIRIVINRIEQASIKLDLDRIMISNLSRGQLKQIMEASKFPNNYYNKARAYISTLFNELLEYECCENNLIRDIGKKKTIKKTRDLMTKEEMDCVLKYFKTNLKQLYIYSMIFRLSASRSSELFRVKYEDVDLNNQEYKITIKKRNQPVELIKVILKDALPFWKIQMDLAKTGDYLWSKNLLPGTIKISPIQITRRWSRHVKNSNKIKGYDNKPLNITADFYSFKHSFLDSLPEAEAQMMAEHLSGKTTEIYQVNKMKRQRELLKKLRVSV